MKSVHFLRSPGALPQTHFQSHRGVYEVYAKCHEYDTTHIFDAMIELLDS